MRHVNWPNRSVLVTLDSGTIPAIIIPVGGFLSVGEKPVAIPVNQIKVGSEAKFTTELTKEQLTAAPAFVYGKPTNVCRAQAAVVGAEVQSEPFPLPGSPAARRRGRVCPDAEPGQGSTRDNPIVMDRDCTVRGERAREEHLKGTRH